MTSDTTTRIPTLMPVGVRPPAAAPAKSAYGKPRLAPLTAATATGAAADMLTELEERHGQVGQMVSTMAHSPAVLGGYLQLSRALRRAKLSRRTSELVSIAVQAQQECTLCLEAHEAAARTLGVTAEEIRAARRGHSDDPKVAVMIAVGLAVYRNPAAISDAQVEELRSHGYTDREIVDVVGVVALNLLTGAFNLVAGLEPERYSPGPEQPTQRTPLPYTSDQRRRPQESRSR